MDATLVSMPPTTSFEVSFLPRLELVPVVRRFVSDLYERATAAPDVVAGLAVATHELLENASKYSRSGESGMRLDLEDGEDGTISVVLRVWNHASAEQVEQLREVFRELHAEPDPMAHYLACMRKAAKRKQGSGLGLARVRYESQMDLSLQVDGERVEITGRARVRGAEGEPS